MTAMRNESPNPRLSLAVLVAVPVVASACGGGADLAASTAARPRLEPRVTITPALDLSGLGLDGSAWADRLVIESVTVHLDDVRLLGADPRIPSGGLDLLESSALVAAEGGPGAALNLPFPRQFAGGEDLAVFVRVAPAAALEGASVEVYARLYAEGDSPQPSGFGSSTSRLASIDPDVDRAREGDEGGPTDPEADSGRAGPVDTDDDPARPCEGRTGHVDPDVDPARPCEGRTGHVDPDVDPARPPEEAGPGGSSTHNQGTSSIRRSLDTRPSVAFVLRDEQAADMVATLGARSMLDVVIGIPAARWFAPDVIQSLERTLDASAGLDGSLPAAAMPDASGAADQRSGAGAGMAFSRDRNGLIEIRRGLTSIGPRGGTELEGGRSYFLTSDERIDGNGLRRPR